VIVSVAVLPDAHVFASHNREDISINQGKAKTIVAMVILVLFGFQHMIRAGVNCG